MLPDKDQINVRYTANLARLGLTEQEIVAFQAQIGQVVEYVRKIAQLDLSAIEPMSHAHPVLNVFRSDKVVNGLNREDVMRNAPESDEHQFKVPRIVE